jgi:hypothetical protein
MYIEYEAYGVNVHRCISGLEITFFYCNFTEFVHRCISGLEKQQLAANVAHLVHRCISGLEKTKPLQSMTV